jgi:hypothetical protein
VVTAQLAVDELGVDRLAHGDGHRRFKRAVGIAIGTVALGAVIALLVGLFEDHLLAPAAAAAGSARVQLPADLFTAPRAPKPQVVVRYAAPRSARPAAVAAAPSTAAPAAAPTPSRPSYPSPSPSPTWRGDD